MSNDAKRGMWGALPRGWGIGAALLLALGFGGCYQGGQRDKEAPAGLPGGLCLAPDGFCQGGHTCNRNENYCFDPADPCNGFFCGGEDRGVCFPDMQGLPSCQCDPGYTNDMFALYCCPDDSLGIFDERCAEASAGASSGSG